MEIRALRPDDDRSVFKSGEESLDRFFYRYAGQNQFRHHLGMTYVAVEDGRLLGCATVAPGQIEVDRLPAGQQKKLPRYPLPILRLARLAVDQSARSQGIGTALLGYVCRIASKMAGEYACAGVVVDAKPEAVSFYAKYGFASYEPLEGGSEARPKPALMFLAIQAIKAAARES